MKLKIFLVFVVTFNSPITTCNGYGEVKLAALISDHMVIQRNMPVHLWETRDISPPARTGLRPWGPAYLFNGMIAPLVHEVEESAVSVPGTGRLSVKSWEP
jgi:hypothetical protein